MTIVALIATLLIMLLGQENKHWCFYETDTDWWQLRLWTRRN